MKQLTDLFHKCFYNGLTFDCNGSKGTICIYSINDYGDVKIITYGSLKKWSLGKPEDELNRMHQEVNTFIESHYVKESAI